MSLNDRENGILEYLRQSREASIDELCDRFFVSVATMRRDLTSLAESGKIIRTHGGAFLSSTPGESIPQELREREFVLEKEIIAKRCLELITDGDSVMIDGSSTCLQLMKILDAKKSIVVITNSTKAPFVSQKTGKSFSAALKLDGANVTFVFSPRGGGGGDDRRPPAPSGEEPPRI